MTLLPASAFSMIFRPLRSEYVGLVEAGGNAGDRIIHEATRQLCDKFRVRWGQWSPESEEPFTRLLLFGGGNMGSPYEGGREIRRAALSTGIPCDQLPQSWMAPEDSGCERTFVRERASLQMVPGGILAPDLALGYEYTRPRVVPVLNRELFVRIDGEGLFANYPPHDPTRYTESPDDYLAAAARCEHIITDRLHFAIAGLMVKRRVTLLPNSYHKNRSMWETWLCDLGCEWSESP